MLPGALDDKSNPTDDDPEWVEVIVRAGVEFDAIEPEAGKLHVAVIPAVVFVQLNWSAAVLLFPAASVNVLPATSMVHAPSPDGVNVAV